MSAPLDRTAIRKRLAGLQGRDYWRSLEELARTETFQEYLHREFPSQASEWTDPIGRRRFLQLMAASLALAGATACTRMPSERILPYVRQPEEIVPGRPLYFATAMPLGGIGSPILVESHMGRPTKIEGNPDHGASLGAVDPFTQASILELYDPERAQAITFLGEIRPWMAFLAAIQAALATVRPVGGRGFRLLTETVGSPALADQIRTLLAEFPEARWHQYEPVNRDAARAGARAAFGRQLDAHYRLDRAEVIVSLDADFLACGPGHVRYARDFADRRRVDEPGSGMNRLYVVESVTSVTGSKADHRLPLRPSEVEAFAGALASALGIGGGASARPALPSEWIDAIARDLERHRGSGLVMAGDQQPPRVHALAHAINRVLDNAGRTVVYTEPVEAEAVDQTDSLRELVRDMGAGEVSLLVILGGNPVYTAPADLNFVSALEEVRVRIHLAPYRDETSDYCHWNIPEAHYLESWGDVRAHDGTVSILQPLIAPLYGGRSAHEVLAAMMGQPDLTGHDLVRDYWRRAFEAEPGRFTDEEGRAFGDFEAFWRLALHDGFIHGSALEPVEPPAAGMEIAAPRREAGPGEGDGLELLFRPDATVFDGRFANNGWLQELPKPLTHLTWDNAACLSPDTAARLGVQDGDVVEIRHAGRAVRAPVLAVPGHADAAVSLTLGYGRRRAGVVGTGTGYDAYAIRTADAPWAVLRAEVRPTGDRHLLATTQHHYLMEGRDLVRAGTIDQYREHPAFVKELGLHPPARTMTLYPEYRYEAYKWGMVIDLNACTGCNACVIACQAENNIPIVGKDQVARGREMHWLRVDTYYAGDPSSPEIYHQPVPCMHCEKAPCEVVCPVAATVHSSEGLNDMVYNRCVGTRYCSNNCPYKVRRFNFLEYADWTTETLKMQRNPDVTVRSRGVMEKCTYCVQRISRARIEAKKEGRAIRDGEVVTACQAACPARAIVFGDLNDPGSEVARLHAQPRNYGLLEELNTRPRTTYLAAFRNPNPELEAAGDPVGLGWRERRPERS